ncbi:MAG: tetratricopeptide repeat protein [Terriglobia bacterium]|jgi:tetratricopeptide (TPR) repeat protein
MTAFLRSRLTAHASGLLIGSVLSLSTVSFNVQAFGSNDHPPAPSQIQNPATPSQANITLEERADIFMARKSYADAVDYYYRALKQPGPSGRDTASIWNKLGIAYQQQEHYNAATAAYKKAIRLRSDFPEPWNNLGTNFYMADKIKKSIKYYLRAVELSPASASFHLNLGTGYYRLKKYKEAVDEYCTALTLDPNILTEHSPSGTVMQTRAADSKFYFYLAKSFAMKGRTDEAIRYLRRAFEVGFNDDKLLAQDPDFRKISQNPDYLELMKNPPVPIRD